MLDLTTVLSVFGLVFIDELPDKTALASLVLGTRYRASWVFAGVAAAFTVHVMIAVAAGSVLGLLPHRLVEAIAGALFATAAIVLWRRAGDDDEEDADSQRTVRSTFFSVASMSFVVVFVAEFGDITQILTANLAAKYDDALSVALGAVLALWAVSLVAMVGGKTLVRLIPLEVIGRVAAVVMGVIAVVTLWSALA